MPVSVLPGRGTRIPMLAALALLFTACLGALDSEELRRAAPDAPSEVSCSACHPYPLQDRNHQYHGVNAPLYQKKVNGPVTCLDCHRNSIRFVSEVLRDSIFRDTNGNTASSLDFPGEQEIRTWELVRVDTYVQHHPVPTREAAKAYGYQEWLTGLSHLDGKVDVDFDSAVSDTVRFRGKRAQYDPQQQTCSAVSCHPRSGSYRFSACSQGLPEMRGGTTPLSSCDTAP